MTTLRTRPWRNCLLALSVLTIGCVACALALKVWDQKVAEERGARSIQQEEQLAREYGVKLRDYPSYSWFPLNYLEARLREGMPITTVHEIVQHYVAVYRCPGHREVYDFYETYRVYGITVESENIEIHYDEKGLYEGLKVDDDSDPIDMTDCEPGRLGE